MNKRFFLTLVLTGIALVGSAQLIQNLHTIYRPIFNIDKTDTTIVFTPFGVIKPGINYGLSLGTGFSAFGKGLGMSSTYISPSISYSPNEKLQVIGGFMVSHNGYNGISFPEASVFQGALMSQTPMQVWAYAQYNLNNRLSFYAMGSVEQNQSFFSPYSMGIGLYDSNMFAFGMNYKITEKTSIGFRFDIENSNNPFHNYSRNFGFNNPFYY